LVLADKTAARFTFLSSIIRLFRAKWKEMPVRKRPRAVIRKTPIADEFSAFREIA
jgi:hypothetical protein